MAEEKPVYKCPECGLHYLDEEVAKECAAFCSQYKSCSLEITKHSIERSLQEG